MCAYFSEKFKEILRTLKNLFSGGIVSIPGVFVLATITVLGGFGLFGIIAQAENYISITFQMAAAGFTVGALQLVAIANFSQHTGEKTLRRMTSSAETLIIGGIALIFYAGLRFSLDRQIVTGTAATISQNMMLIFAFIGPFLVAFGLGMLLYSISVFRQEILQYEFSPFEPDIEINYLRGEGREHGRDIAGVSATLRNVADQPVYVHSFHILELNGVDVIGRGSGKVEKKIPSKSFQTCRREFILENVQFQDENSITVSVITEDTNGRNTVRRELTGLELG